MPNTNPIQVVVVDNIHDLQQIHYTRTLPLGITLADLQRLSKRERAEVAAALIGKEFSPSQKLAIAIASDEDNSNNSEVVRIFSQALPALRSDHANPYLQQTRRRNIDLCAQDAMYNWKSDTKMRGLPVVATLMQDPTLILADEHINLVAIATGHAPGWFDIERKHI